MLKWIALAIVCVFSQTYTDHGADSGVCLDATSQANPPNFSKNNQSSSNCRAICNMDTLCVGYSHAVELNESTKNRCAIWIDRTVLTDRGNLYDGWSMHNYPGWTENVLELTGGDGAAGWRCYTRIDQCAAGSMTAGMATVSYPVINQGQYVDINCPQGYTGTVRVECRNGQAVKVGDGTCDLAVIEEWIELEGQGVCRHVDPPSAFTKSVGPGVSPPNFSKEGLSLQQCKDACANETPLICDGISYGGDSARRCALFINTDTRFCGSKSGWETHPYNYGWQTSWKINGVSGEAGWKCYTRVFSIVTAQFEQMAGTGVCANSVDASPSNYSRNGMNENDCQNECAGYAECLGFAHRLTTNRCALYMNVHTQLPGLADWERYLGESAWASDPNITKADQVGSGWLCFRKIPGTTIMTRRKN